MQRYEHFLKWQKIFLGGGKKELNLGPSGQRRATSSSARGVQIPCAEVSVAGFLVALFPGEAKAFAVTDCALVHVGLAVGEVLEVLNGIPIVVGNPAGRTEVVGVVEYVCPYHYHKRA